MAATQDTEIEALLGRLTDEIQRNSNDSLVGLYVYGSLVTGDFDKGRSDIDLLAVVDSNIDADTFGRLYRMHARFVEARPAWDDRIEVAYVPAPALWNFRTQTSQIAIVSPASLSTSRRPEEIISNWYTVREAGATLCGPPPRPHPGNLAPSSSRWCENTPNGGKSKSEDAHARRAVLRRAHPVQGALHTHGGQASKRQAALWAQAYLPQWVSLIQRV